MEEPLPPGSDDVGNMDKKEEASFTIEAQTVDVLTTDPALNADAYSAQYPPGYDQYYSAYYYGAYASGAYGKHLISLIYTVTLLLSK
jgi:hypothetical protein